MKLSFKQFLLERFKYQEFKDTLDKADKPEDDDEDYDSEREKDCSELEDDDDEEDLDPCKWRQYLQVSNSLNEKSGD